MSSAPFLFPPVGPNTDAGVKESHALSASNVPIPCGRERGMNVFDGLDVLVKAAPQHYQN